MFIAPTKVYIVVKQMEQLKFHFLSKEKISNKTNILHSVVHTKKRTHLPLKAE